MDNRLLGNKLFRDVCIEELEEMLLCAKAQEQQADVIARTFHEGI